MTSTPHRLIDIASPDSGPGHAFAHQLMETLSIPVFVLDAEARVVMWNRACELLTGVAASEVLGTRDHGRCFFDASQPTLADQLLAGQPPSERGDVRHLHPRQAPAARLSADIWCDMPRRGLRRLLSADASAVFDERGRVSAVIQTLRDVTDENMARAALEQLATRDGLTGLANRRCFDDTLHAEWARALRQQQPLSLLMVDVDNFKAYNDAHGHLGGDECLKRIAAAVAGEMRVNDLVARYGGEEFAVILPNQSLKGAATVAERIRIRVEGMRLPENLAAPDQRVTVSIGAATAIASAENSAGDLVATADAALYRAKHMGRNRISLPVDTLG